MGLTVVAHLLAAAGVVTASWLALDASVADEPERWSALAVALAVGGAAVALGIRRAFRTPLGRLSVDALGRAFWRAAPLLRSGGEEQPGLRCRVERFHFGARVAWIEVRDTPQQSAAPERRRWWKSVRPGGPRLDLLVGRDTTGADDWRALGAWLTWVERGPQA